MKWMGLIRSQFCCSFSGRWKERNDFKVLPVEGCPDKLYIYHQYYHPPLTKHILETNEIRLKWASITDPRIKSEKHRYIVEGVGRTTDRKSQSYRFTLVMMLRAKLLDECLCNSPLAFLAIACENHLFFSYHLLFLGLCSVLPVLGPQVMALRIFKRQKGCPHILRWWENANKIGWNLHSSTYLLIYWTKVCAGPCAGHCCKITSKIDMVPCPVKLIF